MTLREQQTQALVVQKGRLFTRILDDFDKTNGKVSVVSTTFHLVDAPILDVRLSGHEYLRQEIT